MSSSWPEFGLERVKRAWAMYESTLSHLKRWKNKLVIPGSLIFIDYARSVYTEPAQLTARPIIKLVL